MSQGYISEFLFHFVGRDILQKEEQYELLKKIISDGWISFYPHEKDLSFGIIDINSMSSRKLEEMVNPKCICFADIPIGDLSLHSSKYSKFGIGFRRDFLISKGANPVFYIEKNSTIFKNQAGTNDLVKLTKNEYYQEYCSKTIWYFLMRYVGCVEKNSAEKNKNMELNDTWEILKFLVNIFSHLKPWDDSLDESDPKNFYYEREWRTLNNVDFNLSDIEIICIPEEFKEKFSRDFPAYKGKVEIV
ncbi:MAG TPA: abortive infection system antitoxin AbiGi family protein [Methanoregulaceae archaeon]|nr:abortive infection system antitoxin AbiGi family protein [Methanoregulaceae archaeon]HPS22666.1 abortive infection system antitoxin AbiGi family protein [Methanoregulaceae archaeon]